MRRTTGVSNTTKLNEYIWELTEIWEEYYEKITTVKEFESSVCMLAKNQPADLVIKYCFCIISFVGLKLYIKYI